MYWCIMITNGFVFITTFEYNMILFMCCDEITGQGTLWTIVL